MTERMKILTVLRLGVLGLPDEKEMDEFNVSILPLVDRVLHDEALKAKYLKHYERLSEVKK